MKLEDLTREEVFEHMLKDHYSRFIGSVFHVFLIWLVIFLLFGAPFASFILVFWTGFHLGRGDQRVEIIGLEFKELANPHKFGLLAAETAAIVCLFLYCKVAWLEGFHW